MYEFTTTTTKEQDTIKHKHDEKYDDNKNDLVGEYSDTTLQQHQTRKKGFYHHPKLEIKKNGYHFTQKIIIYENREDKTKNLNLNAIKREIIKVLKHNNIVTLNQKIYKKQETPNPKIEGLHLLQLDELSRALINYCETIEEAWDVDEEKVKAWIIGSTTKIYKRWEDIGFNNGILKYRNREWGFKKISEINKNKLIPRQHYNQTYEYMDLSDYDFINSNLELFKLIITSTDTEEKGLQNCKNLAYAIGYLLIGNNTQEEIIIVLQGAPGSGKTTITNIIGDLVNGDIGEYADSNSDSKYNSIIGNEIALFQELDNNVLSKINSTLKKISGGENLTYNLLYQNTKPVLVKQETPKILIVTNHNLSFDEAMLSRTIPITFTINHRSSENSPKIPFYEKIILEQKTDIINLCINYYLQNKTIDHLHKKTQPFNKPDWVNENYTITYNINEEGESLEAFKDRIKRVWDTYTHNPIKQNEYEKLEPLSFPSFFQRLLKDMSYDDASLTYLNEHARRYCLENDYPYDRDLTLRTLKGKHYFNNHKLNIIRLDFYIKTKHYHLTFIPGLCLTL
ncbi:MAG: hypothetical protein LBB45_03380 [Methanobrevibacter sp.]|jgi:energy-coupling factor transporter ATP-binding protein EcfA2|nr:hypothetical protein [Candidatus Methanovirga basalitermitum]